MQVKLPHCHKETTRHGATVYYFRKGHRPRVRLPDKPGTPAFIAAYNAALNGAARPYVPANANPAHTLAWLIGEYRRSSAWAALSVETRRVRDTFFVQMLAAGGGRPFAEITRKTIRQSLDKRKDRPGTARQFLFAVRAMFAWAVEVEHVEQDPTMGLRVKVPRSDGYKMWGEAQMAAYEAHWPVGTRERLAYDVLAYTGLRRSDACRLGPQHVQGGVASIRTEKTGQEVHIAMTQELLASIAATKHGETFILSAHGRPYTKESFGNVFGEWCAAAGLQGFRAHGLRKTSATAAANAGATENELMAMHGWSEARTAAIYTRNANRRTLALQGAEKVRNRNKVPHPPAP
ncbi:XerC Integrase [uncultured Caudovirales phage]|uniref:Integrase n=1 Tax=uncultured Caudovirales phage TaxID=2100421 RepID=A0A6J5KQT3_9CAUD|nr:XerC Integrase [uncultured Caudovirales phage]